MNTVLNPNVDHWRKRRRFLFATIAFCMAVIVYILWQEMDTKPAETAVMFSFLTIIGSVGSYVFGAAWEDVSAIDKMGTPAPNPSADLPVRRRARPSYSPDELEDK